MYSKKVLECFENPINIGEIVDADGIGITENEICSDVIKIYIKIDNNIIVDAKFDVKGCPPVIAACCCITDTIKGMNINRSKQITSKQLIDYLGGLPKEKEHCADLVVNTLKKAIENINRKEP